MKLRLATFFISVLCAIGMLFIVLSIQISQAQKNENGIINDIKVYNEKTLQKLKNLNFIIQKGETIEGNLIIENGLANNAVRIEIYATDNTTTQKGSLAFKLKNENQNTIGDWLRFEENKYYIEAKDRISIPYKIFAPENASPGDYFGGVIMEIINDTYSSTNNINIVSRTAVPVFLKIPGEEVIDYSINKFKSEKNDSYRRFFYSIKNNGNTIIIADVKIETFINNNHAVLFKKNHEVLPYSEVNEIYNWKRTKNIGIYDMALTVDIFKSNRSTGEKIHLETIIQKIKFNEFPAKTVLLFLLLITITLSTLFALIFNKELLIKKSANYTIKKNDTLGQIAKKFKTEWTTIAKLNNLKKPYTIKTGRKIKIPIKKNEKE